ncbi:MAG TPA: hypothetical protein VKZ79_19680 [Alphaproteobacteria bacterium]|nr:hypothetical protein [Alphaproteobacteria bacterium]
MLKTITPSTEKRSTRLRSGVNDQAQFETEFESLERRLREDESRVWRQARIVHALRTRGADSLLAEELLHSFKDLLSQRRLLLARFME